MSNKVEYPDFESLSGKNKEDVGELLLEQMFGKPPEPTQEEIEKIDTLLVNDLCHTIEAKKKNFRINTSLTDAITSILKTISFDDPNVVSCRDCGLIHDEKMLASMKPPSNG